VSMSTAQDSGMNHSDAMDIADVFAHSA